MPLDVVQKDRASYKNYHHSKFDTDDSYIVKEIRNRKMRAVTVLDRLTLTISTLTFIGVSQNNV